MGRGWRNSVYGGRAPLFAVGGAMEGSEIWTPAMSSSDWIPGKLSTENKKFISGHVNDMMIGVMLTA